MLCAARQGRTAGGRGTGSDGSGAAAAAGGSELRAAPVVRRVVDEATLRSVEMERLAVDYSNARPRGEEGGVCRGLASLRADGSSASAP